MKNRNLTFSAAGIVVLGVIISAVIARSSKSLPTRAPSADEKTMLVTVADLADFGYTNLPREVCETWWAQPTLSGITEVDYEYDSEKQGDEGQFIYMSSDATCEPSIEFAEQTFDIAVEAMQHSAKMGAGAHAEEKADLFGLGDEAYSAQIILDDSVYGNIVVVRKGRVVHSLIVTGLYFDQQEDLEDLFEQALEKSSPDKFAAL